MKNNKNFFQKYKKQLLIIFLAVLTFSLLLYFLFLNTKTDANGNKVNNLPSFNFSFSDLFNSFKNETGQKIDENATTSIVGEISGGLEDYYFEGLIKVWGDPVAGYDYYTKPYVYTYQDENGKAVTTTLTKTLLQFVDSKTGFIYEKDLSEPTSTPYQVTKQSYPNTLRAYFMNDTKNGKGRVFLQYLASDQETIKTVTATIPESTSYTANLLNVTNLSDNIKFITTSPNNQKLAYLLTKKKTTNGFQDSSSDWYYLDKLSDTYGERVHRSELTDWKLILLNTGEMYAYTTDSYSTKNTLYQVDKTNSSLDSLSLIYGDHNGMSFLINQNNLLVSLATANGLKTYTNNSFRGAETFSDYNLTSLNFQTLVNKCTQNDSENQNLIICAVPKEISNYEYGLPDAWYQGMTTWEDNLYVVNQDYPLGQLLFDFQQDSDYTEKLDAKSLKISDDKIHLGFLNKNDSSLWTLNIANILNTNTGE